MQPRLELGWKLVELTEKVSIRHPIDPQSITIYEDPFYSDAYIIALPLDSDPSYVWLTLFEQELWSSLDFWDRKVVVLGREIRLVTTRERVGDKLGWLEERVNATNRRVDEYNRKIKGEEQAKETGPKDEEAIRSELSSWLLRSPVEN
jgi:hypothetical protein